MYHADNDKREKKNNARNEITKSGKYQNSWRKGKLFANIGSGYNQTEMKKKIRREYLRWARKLHAIKLCCRKFIKVINILIKYSGLFLEWTRETQTNGIKENETGIYEQGLTPEKWQWLIMCQENKAEEDSQAIRVV